MQKKLAIIMLLLITGIALFSTSTSMLADNPTSSSIDVVTSFGNHIVYLNDCQNEPDCQYPQNGTDPRP